MLGLVPATTMSAEDQGRERTVFHLYVITYFEARESERAIELNYLNNRSLIVKWRQAKQKIYEAAASEYKKHLKIRPARKYFYI